MMSEVEVLIERARTDGITRIVVGAIVGRRYNGSVKILVLDRQAEDFMGEIEELPSGKVEGDEMILEALSRELSEETKLEMTENVGYLFSFDYKAAGGHRTRQFNFMVKMAEGEVTVNDDEHVGYRWIGRDEIKTSRLTENIKKALLEKWENLERVLTR